MIAFLGNFLLPLLNSQKHSFSMQSVGFEPTPAQRRPAPEAGDLTSRPRLRKSCEKGRICLLS